MALVVKEEGSEITEEDIVKCVNGIITVFRFPNAKTIMTINLLFFIFPSENMSEYKQLRGGVCFVDAIPRTATGKIKRLALQELAKTLYMDD